MMQLATYSILHILYSIHILCKIKSYFIHIKIVAVAQTNVSEFVPHYCGCCVLYIYCECEDHYTHAHALLL